MSNFISIINKVQLALLIKHFIKAAIGRLFSGMKVFYIFKSLFSCISGKVHNKGLGRI